MSNSTTTISSNLYLSKFDDYLEASVGDALSFIFFVKSLNIWKMG